MSPRSTRHEYFGRLGSFSRCSQRRSRGHRARASARAGPDVTSDARLTNARPRARAGARSRRDRDGPFADERPHVTTGLIEPQAIRVVAFLDAVGPWKAV